MKIMMMTNCFYRMVGLQKILFPGGTNARDFHHEFRFMVKLRVCVQALFITPTSYSPGTGVLSP